MMRQQLLLSSILGLAALVAGFDPKAYPLKTVQCAAVNRAENKTVEISLEYVEINPTAERTILMVHGWPGAWSTWRSQIELLQNDYHLIVPSLRGFGGSQHPGDIETSGTMPDLVNDMQCILEHAGVSKAVSFGHDWGTQVAYETARQKPQMIDGVVAISLPYIPYGGNFTPIPELIPAFPHLGYQEYFLSNATGAAAELNADIRRSLRSTLRTVASPPPADFLESTTSYLAAWSNVSEIPPVPFFSREEENYIVQQYSIQGFYTTLYLYQLQVQQQSWAAAQASGNFQILQPVESIFPTGDPVANWTAAAVLLDDAAFVPNTTAKTAPGEHWPHLESADVVNGYISAWLSEFYPARD